MFLEVYAVNLDNYSKEILNNKSILIKKNLKDV